MNVPAAIAGGIAAVALVAGGTTAAVIAQTGDSSSSTAALASCGFTVCAAGANGSSFASASAAASAGDTVTVEPGTYPAQTILAASTKPTGSAVVFDLNGVTVTGDLTLGSTSSCTGAQNLEFDGGTVSGSPTTRCGSFNITLKDVVAQGVNLGGGSNLTVQGGSFGPSVNDNSEIKNGATNVLIDSATFHDYLNSYPIGATRPHTECIQVWGDSVVNLTVRNTIFRNCTDFDVLVKGTNFSGIVFTDSFFDNPMPGDASNGSANGTVTCNPNCPRGGSALRFSTYTYPNSSVTNNVMNGSLTIDCGCVATSGNAPGVIPPVPPGGTTTTTTTTTQPTTSTTSTTTTTEPPPPTDMAIFCDDYVHAIQAAAYYAKWSAQNPGELARWTAYRDGICIGPNVAVPSMLTFFGKALVDAGRMAQ